MLPLSSISRASPSTTALSLSFIALYSTVSGLVRRNWGTSGPKPPSLFQSEDEVQPELPRQGRAARLKAKTAGERTPKQWAAHRETLKKVFPQGWAPPRKLSRDAMDGLRMLHAHDPATFSTPVLAEKFRISPEAVRRILKSRWEPSRDQRAKLLQRERQARQEWIAQQRAEEKEAQADLLRVRSGRKRADKNDHLTLT